MARNLFNLTGRVVVATGGNSGIGHEFLTGCAKQGADVVIWDRETLRDAAALAKLRAAGAGRTHSETVDVSDEVAVESAFRSTISMMGRVDCVFVNAGIMSRAPSFPDMSSDMYHQLLNVNLHGAFYTLREAARHMRARASASDAGGSIVVCGSLSIFHALQGMKHYAGSKGALSAMVKSLAVELGPYQIRVNMLAPGFILSGMTSGNAETERVIGRMSAVTPLGRPGTSEDVEGPAAYLVSEASKFQTGDILVIDGGQSVA